MSLDDLFAGDESTPPSSSYPDRDSSHCSTKEEVLIRLKTEGACPILYTLVQCKEHAFSILATDGDYAWEGELSHAKMKEMADTVKLDFDELLKMSQKALIGEQVEGVEFLYSTLLVGEDKMKFVWKKHMGSDGIKIVLGSVVLASCKPQQAFCRMMDHALAKMAELEANIEELAAEKERLLRERNVILQQLDKSVSDKEDLESSLYGKFKLVLNEKKAKIRRLMESLTHLSQQKQAKSNEPTNSSRRNVDSGDESDGATDEVSVTPSPKSKQPDEANEEGISSLLRNNWQDDRTSPPVKRRKREPRQRVAPVEIPRLLPSISSGSTSGRRPLRRRSESVESEDLLSML